MIVLYLYLNTFYCKVKQKPLSHHTTADIIRFTSVQRKTTEANENAGNSLFNIYHYTTSQLDF